MSRQEQEMLGLIQRYLSGECTPEEKQMVHDWLSEDSIHQEYFNAIKKVWDVAPSYDVDVDFEEEWKRISRRLGIDLDESTKPKTGQIKETNFVKPKDHPIKYLLRVAAIILLVAVPAIYFANSGGNSETTLSETRIAMQKIETDRGERASMEFSDGSKITLNSMSTVRFPKVFKESRREIYLEGEAFFRVTHNEDAPFIVHTNGVDIRVLGTEFNVNSYNQDGTVEVVVRDGKVAVRQNKSNRSKGSAKKSDDNEKKIAPEVILTKGQRTLVKIGELPSQPEKVSLLPYLAWVNGRMVFEGTPMRDVISRLKRAYDLNFEVRDSTLLSKRLKASFKRETPKKVLGIIAFSLGVDYELHEDTVIFKSKTKGIQ